MAKNKSWFQTFKEYIYVFIAAAGAVIGYLFMSQKAPLKDMPKRPPKKPDIEMPERPEESGWKEKKGKELEKLEKYKNRLKNRAELLSEINSSRKKK